MGRPAGRLKSAKSLVFTELGTTGRLFTPAAPYAPWLGGQWRIFGYGNH